MQLTFFTGLLKSLVCPCMILLLLLGSCEEKNNLDTKQLSKEIKERKIKKILPAEIIDNAGQVGKKLVSDFSRRWKTTLVASLETQGVEYSKKYCIVPFIPGYDSLRQQGIVIKKIGKNSRDGRKISAYEQQIAQAYLYNVEKNLPSFDNVQKIDPDRILFTSPIYVKDNYCLQCHQTGQNNITSYNLNEYCGFWSVSIPTKEIVMSIH